MKKITLIAEQLTIDGTTEYMVYYDDGSVEVKLNHPDDEDV